MKVLIIQPDLRDYRLPFYNQLAKQPSIELTVLHSGRSVEGANFCQIIAPVVRCTVFYYQNLVDHDLEIYDRVVIGLDARWISSVISPFFLDNANERLVFWGHGEGRSRLANLLRRFLVQHSRSMIFYSDERRLSAIQSGWNPSRMFVAPNTMWVSNAENLSHSYKKHFVYVGRLQDRKSIDLLIESYGSLSPMAREEYNLVILGDGDIKEKLLELVNRLQLCDCVTFLQGTSDESVLKEIFRSSLAYVSPGHVGLGVLHAFSYGIPVVTCHTDSHAPEVGYLKSGINSLICNKSKVHITNALSNLIGDITYARELGNSAYSTYINSASPKLMLSGFMAALL